MVKDEEGHAYGAYLLPNLESGIFVVRPDGILGVIVDSTAGLEWLPVSQANLKLVFV
jgi:hypothetical protein